MIRFALREDFFDIINLWNTVFGDSKQVIESYLERFFDRVLLFYEDDTLAGMLSLLPISTGKETGFYVYAVATDERFRSKGIATKLIEHSKKLCGEDKFLILVPASESLFEFYKKFDFYEISCLEKNIVTTNIEDDILPLSLISSTELLIMRKECFKNINFFEWDIDVLNLMHDCFGYKFLKFDDDLGFAVCEIFKNTVNVKELCCRKEHRQAALSSICKYFNCSLYSFTIPAKTNIASAMIWGKHFKSPYFNLALD